MCSSVLILIASMDRWRVAVVVMVACGRRRPGAPAALAPPSPCRLRRALVCGAGRGVVLLLTFLVGVNLSDQLLTAQ